jgi:replicative DNA helicase
MKVSSTAHLQHHSILLVQKWMQRSLAPLGNDLLTSAFDDKQDPLEVIDQTRGKLDALVDQVDQNNDKTTVELMSEMFREVERISQNDGTLVGIDTGFRELNHLTGGWQKGDLIIIGARPGMGKTAFAIRQAIAAAKAGHGVAFFSYEMTPEQLMKRVVSNESETIHANMLFKHGIHKDHQWTSLMETMQQIEKWSGHLHILQRFGDVNELAMAVRKYKRRSKVDLVIVDYIQLIAPPKAIRSNANREQEVSYTSRQLKRLAQELGISVMALSQLSRQLETRAEKRPRLSDLRESGAIEQDADVIGFLYRENYYNGDADPNVAEVIISKQRNGGQDIITAGYDANHVRYYDLQTETPYVNEDPAF